MCLWRCPHSYAKVPKWFVIWIWYSSLLPENLAKGKGFCILSIYIYISVAIWAVVQGISHLLIFFLIQRNQNNCPLRPGLKTFPPRESWTLPPLPHSFLYQWVWSGVSFTALGGRDWTNCTDLCASDFGSTMSAFSWSLPCPSAIAAMEISQRQLLMLLNSAFNSCAFKLVNLSYFFAKVK